jgi:tRNA (guanine-N7-)-methyltransferase
MIKNSEISDSIESHKFKTYGRKKSRTISCEKQAFVQDMLARLSPLQGDFPENLWMEVGFGYGDHLLQWMRENREISVLGVDVFVNGIAHFLSNLSEQERQRCRLFQGSIHELLPQLPSLSIEGIFILFPDPWPKKAHHKRRLVQKEFLDHCFRVLKPGGQIWLASDNPPLVQWMMDQLSAHGQFQWHSGVQSADPATWGLWPWPSSRYQQKAHGKGDPCAHMIWIKPR